MKSLALLALLGAFSPSLAAVRRQLHDGAASCDVMNENFTELVYGSPLFDHSHDNDDDDDDDDDRRRRLDKFPVFEFISCNDTYFTVTVNGEPETLPVSIYEVDACLDDDDDDEPADAAKVVRRMLHNETLTSNCYYAYCGPAGEVVVDPDAEEGHEGVVRRVLFRNDDYIMYTAHVEVCCSQANATVKAHPHHSCSVPDFFAALQEAEEPVGDQKPSLAVPVAVGAVAAFVLILALAAWFAPATDRVTEEPVQAVEAKEAAGKPAPVAAVAVAKAAGAADVAVLEL